MTWLMPWPEGGLAMAFRILPIEVVSRMQSGDFEVTPPRSVPSTPRSWLRWNRSRHGRRGSLAVVRIMAGHPVWRLCLNSLGVGIHRAERG
jgi:hypothetical protein